MTMAGTLDTGSITKVESEIGLRTLTYWWNALVSIGRAYATSIAAAGFGGESTGGDRFSGHRAGGGWFSGDGASSDRTKGDSTADRRVDLIAGQVSRQNLRSPVLARVRDGTGGGLSRGI